VGQRARVAGPRRRNLESEAGPAAVFSEAGHALLILGEPGGGKTITLLELARELIERFERDPHQPAPVVLNLSTWDRKRGALAGWIQSELKTKYFVPLRRSRNWLAGSRLVLLLDGLDEVRAKVSPPALKPSIASSKPTGRPESRFAADSPTTSRSRCASA
jgi:predicted NACHT family NTPase